jgi:hypothetical protein
MRLSALTLQFTLITKRRARMIKDGYWSIYSKTDPRWKGSGKGMVYGGGKAKEATALVKKLTKAYGEPPDDLEYSWMKD